MENDQQLISPVQFPRRRDQEPNPEWERATALGKATIGITGSAIMAGVSLYKDVSEGTSCLLFKAGGLSLLLTFITAAGLTNFQLHVAPGAQRNRCTDLSSAVLVVLTSVLLMATNTMFVALMNKDDTLLVILVLPVVLVLGMLAGADVPADAAAQGTAPADQVGPGADVPADDAAAQGTTPAYQVGPDADMPADATAQGTAPADQVGPGADVLADAAAQGTAPTDQVGPAYDDWMKRNNELASFSATTAFVIEGIMILAYLEYPSFGGAGHSQVDLAVSFFAATISVLAMTFTALPVRNLFPSARPLLVMVVGHLRCAMLAALISMAIIIAVEFLEWWLMLSLVPEVIVGSLSVAMMSWREGGGGAPGPEGGDVVDGGAAARERMVKLLKIVATMSFTLMAGTYALCLGHNRYDVNLRAAMLVMLASIVSSLRQILSPFDLDLARARGWWAVAIGAVSLLFPGLALVIAGPLLVKLFVQLFVANSKHVS